MLIEMKLHFGSMTEVQILFATGDRRSTALQKYPCIVCSHLQLCVSTTDGPADPVVYRAVEQILASIESKTTGNGTKYSILEVGLLEGVCSQVSPSQLVSSYSQGQKVHLNGVCHYSYC